jgi:hypothetical protein
MDKILSQTKRKYPQKKKRYQFEYIHSHPINLQEIINHNNRRNHKDTIPPIMREHLKKIRLEHPR